MSAEHGRHTVEKGFLQKFRDYDPATSRRLMLGLRANVAPFVREIHTQGESNLDRIPDGAPVIWAMTHATSDVELQSGMLVVGEKFDTVMTDHSTHHSMEDAVPFVSQKLVGMDNFYPITYKRGSNGESGKEVFNGQDFDRMLQAFQEGKAVAMAAHNPSYTGVLPDKAGYGAVALASLASSKLGRDVLIVPVAMEFHEEEPLAIGGQFAKAVKDLLARKRTDVTVHVGETMTIDPVDMEMYMKIRSKPASEITHEDRHTIRNLNAQLRQQGGKIMEQIATLLPPHKRGIWGKTSEQS